MKTLATFVATLFASVCISIIQAQNIGDDFTNSLANPSFEEEFTSLATTPAKYGRRFQPNGWTLSTNIDGWNDLRVVTSGEIASDKKNQYYDSYAGNQHVSYWAEKVTSMDLHQDVSTLPVGGYQFSAMVRLVTHTSNIIGIDNITNQHLFAKIQEGGDSIASSVIPKSAVGDTPGNWQKLTVLFNVKEGQTVRLGITSYNPTANEAGSFQIDDCHLTYLGNGDAFVAQMLNAIAEYKSLSEIIYNDITLISGVQSDLDKALDQATKAEATTDSATLGSAFNTLKIAYLNAEEAMKLLISLQNAIEQATNDEALNYPGLETFTEAKNKAIAIGNSDVEYLVYKEDLEKAITDLAIASRKYQLSSLEGAGETTPKDATWVISCPDFTNTETGAVASIGWVPENVASTSSGNSDFRLNTVNGKNCWNSWSKSFTSMNLYQDLTDLPSGKYSVSCLTTTDGIPHDQHAYIISAAGSSISPVPVYYYEGTSFSTEAGWNERIETGKVFVGNDGKLRIGMRSTSGEGTSGWFCTTDFVLTYYGMTDTDYAKALEDRIAKVASYQDSALLKGDKSLIAETVENLKNTDKNNTQAIDAAFIILNESAERGEKSITAYGSYMNGEYATSQQYLSADDPTITHSTSKTFLKKVIDKQELIVNADTTHYIIMTDIINQLDAYNNYIISYDTSLGYIGNEVSFMDALIQAQNLVNEYAEKKVIDSLNMDLKAAIAACQNYEKAVTTAEEHLNMGGYTPEGVTAMQTVLNEQEEAYKKAGNLSEIQNAAQAVNMGIRALQLATVGDYPKDITAWINNPTILQENGSTNKLPNGWSGTTSGSNGHFTKDASGDTFFETWNSTASTINFNYHQTVSDLPSGYYRLVTAAYNCQGAIPNGNGVLYATSNKGEYQTPVSTKSALEKDSTQLDDATFVDYIVDSILVTYGPLTIGVKNIGALSAKWFAADNFRLYFLKAVDATDIEKVKAEAPELIVYSRNGYIIVENEDNYTIITLTGETVSAQAQLLPGIYIVKAGSRITKVAVE